MFSHKSTADTPKIKIKGTNIDWTNAIKYLGVYIDHKLNFVKHVHYTIAKATAARIKLYPLLNSKSSLSLTTKAYIFKAYIKPIITYASSAWSSNLSNHSWLKIESAQSTTLRSFQDDYWFISNHSIRHNTALPTVKEDIEKAIKKLKNQI